MKLSAIKDVANSVRVICQHKAGPKPKPERGWGGI